MIRFIRSMFGSFTFNFSFLFPPSLLIDNFFYFFPVCLFLQNQQTYMFSYFFFLTQNVVYCVFHLAIYSRNHCISVNKCLSHSILQQHIFTPFYFQSSLFSISFLCLSIMLQWINFMCIYAHCGRCIFRVIS